jgi:hypothetical protein
MFSAMCVRPASNVKSNRGPVFCILQNAVIGVVINYEVLVFDFVGFKKLFCLFVANKSVLPS